MINSIFEYCLTDLNINTVVVLSVVTKSKFNELTTPLGKVTITQHCTQVLNMAVYL